MTAGDDFKTLTVDVAIHVTADNDVGGANGAFKKAVFTNADIGF